MRNDLKYKCSCCGGHINRSTMICEYCGTRYEDNNGDVIRIETFQNPVRTLASQIAVDKFLAIKSPQEYSEFAVKTLARQFADVIVPYMELQCLDDPISLKLLLSARLKVIEPINKATDVFLRLSKST